MKNVQEAMSMLETSNLIITYMKSTCAGNCQCVPRCNVFKKCVNSATQTDKSNYLKGSILYKKSLSGQSKKTQLEIPVKPINSLSINTSTSNQGIKAKLNAITTQTDPITTITFW